MLWSLEKALTECGHQVVSFERGEDAIPVLEREKFDFIISDYRLPGISGLDIFKHCRDFQKSAQFILISAYSLPQVSEEWHHFDEVKFMSKPIKIHELIDELQSKPDGVS